MSEEDTTTIRVTRSAQAFLSDLAEEYHVSVAFLVDFMVIKTKDELKRLFSQKPKA